MTIKETWKPVTISGFTGILMGAASTYGVQKLMDGETSADGHTEAVKTATVSDGLSFKEAFMAARAEVGPGGVFEWHGNLYNTYTAEEWNAKSHHEQRQFAQRVMPDQTLAVADTPQTDDNDVKVVEQTTVEEEDVPLQTANIEHTTQNENDDVVALQDDVTWDDLKAVNDDDVRVIGFREIEFARGRSVAMEEFDFNGQRVAVIDVDKDGTADLAMSDLNHNHQMDEGEVIDLHTGEELSFTNDTPDDSVQDIDGFPA